ncbi:MAG: hypothetical protein [Bacteriophage sp.]|nr:MAG: hypothetical protein [Bacteriophage sp.]
MDSDLKKAYSEIMATSSGQKVLKDLLVKFKIFAGTYNLNSNSINELSDLAFREGQRNSGSYIYQNMIASNPEKTSQIQASIFKDMLEYQKDIIDQLKNNEDD